MKMKVDSPVRNIRRVRTMSQLDLAMLVGVSQKTISTIENGAEPSESLKARIAAVLGVPVSHIFPEAV